MAAGAWEAELDAAIERWQSGDVDGAIARCIQLSAEFSSEWKVRALCGAYLYERGDLESAVPHLEAAVELSPASEIPARSLFHAYLDLGRDSDAKRELRRFHGSTESAKLKKEWARLIRLMDAPIAS